MTRSLLELIPLLRQKYERGENVIEYITENFSGKELIHEAINISYDLQSGSYVKNFHVNPDYYKAYLTDYSQVLNDLPPFNSLLEAGVGEGTTLIPLLSYLNQSPENVFGFDSSWSRIFTGLDFAKSQGKTSIRLAVGNMFQCPFPDDSIDVVYTSHAIEPNGGMETEALKELYRVTGKYLVLFEPIYEFADEKGKERMDRLGYIKGLYQTAINLGLKVIKYELLSYNKDLINPTGVLVIEKETSQHFGKIDFCCPVSRNPLTESSDCFFNKESGLAYPKIMGIPCLKVEQAIVATKI